ncbi:MAG: HNH endonuclease [Bacteroidia bacterium]
MNCFGCLNMTKPLPFKMYADKVRGESIFLQKEFDDWKVAKNLEANEIYEVEKHLKFKTSNAYFYLSHLQSNYWRSIRLQVLERDEWLCQSCKQTKAIDVHHLTYKNLGNEELNDLISYCRPCHDEVHNK